MILSDIQVLINNANFKGPIRHLRASELSIFVFKRINKHTYSTLSGYTTEYILSNRPNTRILTKTYYKDNAE